MVVCRFLLPGVCCLLSPLVELCFVLRCVDRCGRYLLFLVVPCVLSVVCYLMVCDNWLMSVVCCALSVDRCSLSAVCCLACVVFLLFVIVDCCLLVVVCGSLCVVVVCWLHVMRLFVVCY